MATAACVRRRQSRAPQPPDPRTSRRSRFVATCLSHSSPTIRRCVFTADTASAGSAIYCESNSSPVILDCSFLGNSGNGALTLSGGSPTVARCTFDGNVGGAGPAVYLTDAWPLFTNCVFVRNVAAYAGGAIASSGSTFRLEGCTFAWNVATRGGGVFLSYQDSPRLGSCTFYGNRAANGAGLLCQAGDVQIENSIIAFGAQGQAVECDDGQATFSCCDLYGNHGGDWVDCAAGQQGVNGNIHLDPAFCDAANGDFDLEGNSPCRGHTPSAPDCDLMGAWPVGCASGVQTVGLSFPPSAVWVRPNPCSGSCRIFFNAGRA